MAYNYFLFYVSSLNFIYTLNLIKLNNYYKFFLFDFILYFLIYMKTNILTLLEHLLYLVMYVFLFTFF
jgi:hypothetical protein